MATTVSELLEIPFYKRTHDEKVKIIIAGKPNPEWISTTNELRTLTKVLNLERFNEAEWLTSCEKTNQIFCWPCLLFMSSKTWNIPISPSFPEQVQIHEDSLEHMETVFKLQIFIMQNIQKSNADMDKKELNENAKNNREIIVRLTDAVFSVAQNPQSHFESKGHSIITTADCINFLNLLKQCDRLHSDVADAAIVLLKESPKILSDLVEVITKLWKRTVTCKIRKSRFVSIILQEHYNDSVKKSQVSTILRYIDGKSICETFVGFINSVDGKCGLDRLESHIMETIKDYEISEKLIAVSVDGAVLSNSELKTFSASLKKKFKSPYFLPCYFPGIGKVLLQSLQEFEECRLFLKMLNEIEIFFEDEHRFTLFEKFLYSKIPNLKKHKWYVTSPFITMLSMYRTHFVNFFCAFVSDSTVWHEDDLNKAAAFRNFLQELQTVFLLKMWNKILCENFDRMYNFTEDHLGRLFSHDQAHRLENHISLMKEAAFTDLWIEVTVDVVGEKAPNDKKMAALNNPVKNVYVQLFQNIMDHMYNQLNLRFEDIYKVEILDLFHHNAAGLPSFKKALLSKLQISHGDVFDSLALNSEIVTIKESASSYFCKKSVLDLLEMMVDSNFGDVFVQVYKILEFVLALPIVTPDPKCSKLRTISNFSYIPEFSGTCEISVLRCETEIFRELMRSETFQEDVLKVFREINKQLNFQQV